MAIREIKVGENLPLDPAPAAKSTIRELKPGEYLPLDADRAAQEKPGLLRELGSSLDVGTRELGNSAVTAAMLYGQIDPERAADFISSNKEAAAGVSAGISPETRRQMETINNSEGFFETAKNVITNPKGTLNLSVQNLPQAAPGIAAAYAGGRAGTTLGAAGGAGIGLLFPPIAPITTAAGAVLGGAGGAIAGGFAGQVPVEVGSWVDQALADRGIDISTREARIAAYRNKPVMDEIRGEAERKGITTAAVDSLWNLFAGSKLFMSAGQGLVRRVGAGAADVGVQMGGEMVSEGAGQFAAYKGDLSKINPTDIYLEGLLSGPQAIGETGAGLLVRDKAAEAMKTGQTQQTLGGNGNVPAPPPAPTVVKKTGAPLVAMMQDTAPAPPPGPVLVKTPLTRDDLAAAINNNTPLPTSKTVEIPQVDIDPALQAQGFVVGAKAQQTTADGEILEGTVVSAQMTDGEIEVTVLDDQGNLRTLFSSDGMIEAAPPAAPPVAPLAPPPAPVAAPPTVTPPAPPVAPPALTPSKPQTDEERLAAMSREELTHHLEFIKNQAKTNGGWNKKTTAIARQVRAELDKRFPEWDIPARVDLISAAQDVAPAPTDGQKDAGNYKKGHVSIQGMPVTIETVKGGVRSGTGADGKPWQVEMPAHYGYIKQTEGADGEHVDVYVGENPSAKNVYVIDQIDPDAQKFDEHKAMIGFSSFDEATEAYQAGFSDGRGPERIGKITTMPVDEFKAWLAKPGARKRPLSWTKPEQADVTPPQPPTAEPQAEEKPLSNDEAARSAYAEVFDTLSNEDKEKFILVVNRWRRTVAAGKADPIAARIGEAFSGSGAISRLNNAINRMPKAKEEAISMIERSEREIKTLESQISGDFPKEAELQNKRKELAAIEKDLKENAPAEVVYDDYPLDYWRANKDAIKNGSDPSFYILGDDEFTYRDNKTGAALTEKMVAAINARLNTLGWPAANFKIYESPDQLPSLTGLDASVEGFYWQGLVYVAMTAKDILGTINHEVIHGLKAAGAFTAAEWSALEGRAAEWRKKYNIEATYRKVLEKQGVTDPAMMERKLNEEAIAHAFQDHANQGPVRRLANKAVRFLKAIAAVLRGAPYNFTSAEAVFDAVGRGDVGSRLDVPPKGGDAAASFSVAPKTDSDAFKKWFGDSKVVDENGKPMVVYHGTDREFEKFTLGKFRSQGQSAGGGFYFTPYKDEATRYAGLTQEKNNGDQRVYAVYLSIKNPFSGKIDPTPEMISLLKKNTPTSEDYIDHKVREWRHNGGFGVAQLASIDYLNSHEKIELLQIAGFDGVRDGRHWVAFSPSQIKSVENIGTFDPADDRIMYSLSKSPKTALEEAKTTLATVSGVDRNMLADLKRVSAAVLHPHQIATLFKEFTPVYRAVIERFKQRETMIHQLAKHIDLYNRLKAEGKKNVNAALEIGRLTGETFKINAVGSIVAKNNGLENTVHSKDGDTITLTPAESAAYLGVRKAMDVAMSKYMDTILEEAGLLEKGVKTIQDVEKLRLDAMRNGRGDEAKTLKNVLRKLNAVADAKKKGYIPFKRWGEIGVSVKDSEGTVVHFERLELPSGWKKKGRIGENKAVMDALERLGKKFNDKEYDINFFEMSKFDEVRTNLDLRNLDILAASSEMSSSDYERLRDMLEREMQKKGFRSHFFESKDVPGYSEDFERAINDYVVTISSYIARRLNEKNIDGAVGAIAVTGKANLYKYARAYQQYVNDPAEEFSAIRMMGFFWYLSGNISSGVFNLSQPFLVTAFWLKATFSHAQIAKNLTRAYADAAAMVDVKTAGMDVFNFDKAPADIRDALVRAYEEGDFLSMATNDAMAISSTSQALRGMDKTRRVTADALGLTFSVPERVNRVATFIVAYRLAMKPESRDKIRDFIKNDELGRSMLAGKNQTRDFAFAFAELAVMSTQYRVGKLNRPQIGRGYGSLVFQFKSYIMQTFELMYRLNKVHGGENKKALATMILAVVALAGLKGIPFEDDAQDLIEALFKLATKKDLDIDTDVRAAIIKYTGSPVLAEAIIKGAPAALMGVDLSGRLGFGNVTPDTQAGFLGVWWDMLYERPVRAAAAASEGDYTRAASEILPAVLRNPLTAYLWSSDGVRTQKGKKVIDNDDLTKADIGLKALGFTSSAVARERELIFATDRASAAVNDLRSSYYSRLARAITERKGLYEDGDTAGADEMTRSIEAIKAEIQRHNQTAPLYERFIISPYVIKKKAQEEYMGAKARKPRKQARLRAQELKSIYKVE